MSEQEIADRFGRDVDDLVRRAEPAPWDAPADYQRSLDVARTLTILDYSAESKERYALRQRLFASAAHTWNRGPQLKRDGLWTHPFVTLPLALVTLVLMCALIIPSSAGWSRIGQPTIALPAIETPVAAIQTAYAEFRGAEFAPTSAPPTVQAQPTPTQVLPVYLFVATGTPSARTP